MSELPVIENDKICEVYSCQTREANAQFKKGLNTGKQCRWQQNIEKISKKRKVISNLVSKNTKTVRQKTFDGQIIYQLGERGSGTRARSQIQDFHTIQKECYESNTLFEDPDFPANDSSIMTSICSEANIKWLRPKEIHENPQFFVDGFSRFDVKQGHLHDCWFIAATANLTMNQRLFGRVVPEDQTFDKNYAGVFHFRFWQYGKWVDVVIDDRLPTVDGELIFMKSNDSNEFWSALFEKAYAKLHGSYGALNNGKSNEAMVDFTGGITESIELTEPSSELFNILIKAYERNSMIACNIDQDPNIMEAETPEGLFKGHAYSITKVHVMDTKTGKIQMVRLRNPWANDKEWNGPWSDKSPEWNNIPDHTKNDIGLILDNDGEFWMSFEDFVKHFDDVEICNLSPSSLSDEQLSQGRKKWEISTYEGQWTKNVTAGGCPNFLDTFWLNPQYAISLENPDENDDQNLCTMICALSQKNRRKNHNGQNYFATIGYVIYSVTEEELAKKPLTKEFFFSHKKIARSKDFYNFRQVSTRFRLAPGNYIIVPSTFHPDVDGDFMIRVFSESKIKMEENDDTIGFIEPNLISQLKSEDNLIDQYNELMEQLFVKVAGDDGEVDWMELKGMLDNSMKDYSESQGFSKDICRSMVAMMDVDKSGKLGLEEFCTLMNGIKKWSEVFKKYDRDNSGNFNAYELREALNSVGYRLNNRVLNALFHRYGSRDGMVYFEDFLMCAIKLKTMIEYFNEYDIEGINLATFNMEEWIEKTVYS